MAIVNKKNKGFTLLEILLVVGIIAILAGVVIVAINPGMQLATVRNSERKADIGEIYKAMQQYYINNFHYPTSTPDSLTEICNTGSHPYPATDINCSGLVNLSILVPTYLVAIPHDPQVSAVSFLSKITPSAYASANGTGYYTMENSAKHIVVSAGGAELGTFIAIGTTTTSTASILPVVNTYTLTVNASHGGVAKSPSYSNHIYDEGTAVILAATPDSGYTFSSWSGDVSGSTNPITVTMTKNETITANFTQNGNSPVSIVVDNADSSGVTKVGSWTASTYSPDYYGSNYLHDGNTGKGAKSVTFNTTAPRSGVYNIYVQNPLIDSHYARATSTPVDILANGTLVKTVILNENVNSGGSWFLLTTNFFNTNDVMGVKIKNDNTYGYVMADAVKFTLD